MKKKGILKIKLGINPNSSSLASDLSYLLMGAVALTFLVNVMDASLRIWRRKKRGTDVG